MWYKGKQTLYSSKYVASLIQLYNDKGGWCYELEEGTLGYGVLVLGGEGLKTTIVKEVALNAWDSAHTIRKYNKMPKKYAELIEKKEEETECV